MTEASNHREIKSYVVRGSRMSSAQRLAWQAYWPEFGLDPCAAGFTWRDIFGNDNPLVLEIGFGMGSSLFEMARTFPQLNFIGIEVHPPGVGALLKLVGEARLENVRIFNCDANIVLDRCIPESSLYRLQLFFPDPWQKKRHHKRRLVQPAFVEKVCARLAPGGVLHMATDWQPYAEWMLEVLLAAPGFTNVSEDNGYCPRPEYRPTTKFERRGLRLGHGVWDILFRRAR
jgi:tRNA (guanine-N7-)-methyltransferase